MTLIAMRELIRRRFPQIVGGYLAVSWGLLEFVDFLAERYTLSGHLVDFTGALLLLMLPSVALVAYNHGAPGRDSWTRIEKAFVPTNLLIAAAVLVTGFSGTPLGTVTTTVVVEDEEGNTVNREVPKAAYRRQAAVFSLDNESGDDSLDWLQYGLTLALDLDLNQDPFLTVWSAQEQFREALREAGRPDGLDVPLGLKQEIVARYNIGHILGGRIDKAGEAIQLAITLHDARTGRLIAERVVEGEDPLALVDELGPIIKTDLGAPDANLEGVVDLPIRERLTDSDTAFRSYVEGYVEALVRENWEAAIPALELAVGEDSTFAYAQFFLYAAYLFAGRVPEAHQALSAGLEHDYRLAERDRFKVRAEHYYTVQHDIDKAVAVAEMRAELYPEEIDAHLVRALYTGLAGRIDDALASYRRVLELDPDMTVVLQNIGELEERAGRFDDALNAYARYVEFNPEAAEAHLALVGLHRLMGNRDASRAEVELTLLIDPSSVPALIKSAILKADEGLFDETEAIFESALEAARTPNQQIEVHEAWGDYYEWRGRIRASLQQRRRELNASASTSSPLLLAIQTQRGLDLYALIGQPDVALDSLAAARQQIPAPYNLIVARTEASVHDIAGDADGLAGTIPDMEQAYEALGVGDLRTVIEMARGRVAELRVDCETAVGHYQEALMQAPRQINRYRDLGRCHRKLGSLEQAAESLHRTLLTRPADPRSLYELALVSEARGARTTAITLLEEALETWAEADRAYVPAAEAREKLAELRAAGEG
jgi:tetratricopeptide (TPR) repeat protein